jgi:RHS repeat-associated protein
LALGAFACFFPLPAHAQLGPVDGATATPIPGAGHDYLGDLVDTVSPADGSVSVRIKTPVPPGRGINVPFSFNYDSNGIWQPYSNPSVDGADLASSLPRYLSEGGWTYGLPRLDATFVTTPPPPPGKGECLYYTSYVFSDTAGGRHQTHLAYDLSPPEPCYNYETASTGGDDQVQAYLSASSGIVSLADPKGTAYTFSSFLAGCGSQSGSSGSANVAALPSTIEDSNGNIVTFSLPASPNECDGAFTVQDTLSRPAISSSGFGSSGNTVSISGLQTPYTVTWGTAPANFSVGSKLAYQTGSGCGGFNADPSSQNVITAIELPNGQSFSFAYDPTYGLLDKVVYPSGAYVSYTWENNPLSALDYFQGSNSNEDTWYCWYEYDTFAIAHRYVVNPSGTTILQQDFSYSTTWPSSGPFSSWTSKQTTVTTHDFVSGQLYTTAHTYTAYGLPFPPYVVSMVQPALPLEQQVVYENGSGQTIRTVNKTWKDQFELQTEQVVLNDGTSPYPTSEIDYTYGAGAQVTEKDEYDYGSGARGNLLRVTKTNYQAFNDTPMFTNGPTIFDRPCQVITYDGNGNRYAETDTFYDSGSTSTVCGTAGTPSVNGAGGSSLTGHDETNYSASSTYPRGNATAVIKQCFPSTSCSGGNPTTTYTYDETGQRLSMTDPKTNVTNYYFTDSYESTNTGSYTTTAGSPPSGQVTNAYLTKITNALGQIETFTYGYNDGELTTSTDANSETTTYRYNDNFGRPTETDYPDQGKTTVQYNDAGPSPSVTTSKLITANTSITSTAVTDGMAHVVQTQLTTDPDGTTYTAAVYDGLARVYESYNPTRCNPPTTNCGNETTWGYSTNTYDALSRTTQVTKPDGSVTTTAYSGNQTTVTDEAGNQRMSQTDALGRLTYVTESPNSLKYLTQYQYDALNDLTSVTQNGSSSSLARNRSFVYDSLTRLTSATNPESGTITYTYDLDSNLSSKVAPKPNSGSTGTVTTNYSYDALNRLTQKSFVGLSLANEKYGYDGTALSSCGQNPPTISSPTNLVGRRSAMCAGHSGSSWSYDPMGRPLLEARINASSGEQPNYSVKYTYNLDGSLSTLTYPSGDVLTYTVGGAERVRQLSDASNSYVGYSGTPATYAPNGPLATMVNGYTSSFEGIATSNVYNDRLQPILLSASVSSTAILSLCYDFHLGVAINSGLCSLNKYTTGNNGNLFQVLDQVNSNLSAAFLYDPLNRISQANTLTAGTDCWAEAYTIDAWGNLTNRAGVSGYNGCSTEGLNASANTNNQLSILTYDNAGNVTNDGNGNQPTYDAENRISVDAGVTYYYDADGMRTEKSSGTKYWPGPGGEVLAETDLDGNINEEYIYFDGARIARVDRPSGTVHYYFSDHLGSASVITDALGNVEQRDYYFPYGGIAYSSGSDPNHYKFTGKERDTESNLDNFGARYYTSNIGRFMTPDWAARATAVPYAVFGDPQTLNLYTYVENAPVNRADADGHSGSNPDVYLPMYGGSINVSAQWFQSLVAAFGAAATPLAEDQAKAQHKPAQTNQINTKPPTADPAGTRTDPKLNPQPDSSKKTSPPTTCTTNCHVTVAVQHGVTQVDNEGTVSLVAPPAVAVNVNVNLHGAAPDQTLLATPSVGLGKWVAVGTDVVKDSSGVHDQGGSVSFGASWPPWPASVSSPASNFTPSGDNWQIGVAQTYPW